MPTIFVFFIIINNFVYILLIKCNRLSITIYNKCFLLFFILVQRRRKKVSKKPNQVILLSVRFLHINSSPPSGRDDALCNTGIININNLLSLSLYDININKKRHKPTSVFFVLHFEFSLHHKLNVLLPIQCLFMSKLMFLLT